MSTKTKTNKELIAILDGRETGRVARDAHGRLSFTYNDHWRTAENAYPLSISMPMALARHGNDKIDPFLWGLLPDNEIVLGQWAQKFHVSARNAFSLIGAVGEDCAGAIQFVIPERVDAILGQEVPDVEWLDEAAVARRLQILRADHSAWRIPRDTGQFSLAGAQPKTALLFDDGRWGVPSGRVPTTHILKPPTGQFDGHAENEHFCLELARSLGLPVVNSRIMHFKDEVAIVVERYDRLRTPEGLRRVHQEDICQALAVSPTHKYQNQGGPGISDIVQLLRTYSGSAVEDVNTFIDSAAFNWLIVGTDAHAKNYALLIGVAGRVRLAPLYDVASVLPYPDIDIHRVKLSMKLGDDYRFRNISARHWRKMAVDVRLDPDQIIARVMEFSEQLADHAAAIARQMGKEGIKHPLIPRLAKDLAKRAKACRKILA
jgi:serine/threonine-protein kinase HipA